MEKHIFNRFVELSKELKQARKELEKEQIEYCYLQRDKQELEIDLCWFQRGRKNDKV